MLSRLLSTVEWVVTHDVQPSTANQMPTEMETEREARVREKERKKVNFPPGVFCVKNVSVVEPTGEKIHRNCSLILFSGENA